MNSETLKNKLKPIVYPIINFIPRRRLKNKNFTIICDNCWAGKVYQELGLPYQTPFVGMFIFSPDYIKMLKNLKHYLSGNIPLTFVIRNRNTSKTLIMPILQHFLMTLNFISCIMLMKKKQLKNGIVVQKEYIGIICISSLMIMMPALMS